MFQKKVLMLTSFTTSNDENCFLINQTKQDCGIGVVVRDDQGRVAAAISKRINEPFGVMEVEAKAFEKGCCLQRI